MSMTTISVRVDSEIVNAVKKVAKVNWISMSSIINLLLREFVATKELHLVDCDDLKNNDWKIKGKIDNKKTVCKNKFLKWK